MDIKPNLAETPEDSTIITYPKYISTKLDGIRAMGQRGVLLSRSLKEIPNQKLQEKFGKVLQGLDGEFLCGDPTDPLVFNKTTSIVMSKDKDIEDVKFYVFDTLELDTPFSVRCSNYIQRVMAIDHPDVLVVPQTLINSDETKDSVYLANVDKGYEGAILRNPSAMYKQGRATLKSQDMLKLKPLRDEEFTVSEIYEAETNLNESFTNELGRTTRSSHQANKVGNGMIGGFVSTWHNGEQFRISAGRLTHPERQDIFENFEKYRGRIGVFTYMPGGMLTVPRHGRFKAWRDKNDL